MRIKLSLSTLLLLIVAAPTYAQQPSQRTGALMYLGTWPNKIVVIDRGGSDTFTVAATVSLTPIDDRMGQLVVRWSLKDPTGKDVGDIEQSNPVPLAAARGSWVGFGDIVAAAAVEGVLELLEKALNKQR